MRIRALQRHARRQMGLFTRAQAIATGWPASTVAWLVANGRWEEIEPGVLRALPADTPTPRQRLMALVLSTGGVAYGTSALELYGLVPAPKAPEVLVVRSHRNRSRAGLHSTRALPRSEIAIASGVPATTPARSLCDAAASLTFERVCELVDAAAVRKLVRPSLLARRALELRNSKRPGCTKVLRALAEQHPELERARSEWEALVLRWARRYGLPDPVPNHRIEIGGRVRLLDAAWPDAKVDLEFDGFRAHMVRTAFDEDRLRQNDLVAAGWLVFRATSNLLRREPERLFGAIERAIGPRGHGADGLSRSA